MKFKQEISEIIRSLRAYKGGEGSAIDLLDRCIKGEGFNTAGHLAVARELIEHLDQEITASKNQGSTDRQKILATHVSPPHPSLVMRIDGHDPAMSLDLLLNIE